MRPGGLPAVSVGRTSGCGGTLARFEYEMGNFGRASVAYRQNHGAEAAAHVDLRSPQSVTTDLEAHLLSGPAVHATDQRQSNLASMRVPRKHEMNAHARSRLNDCRIMREKHGRSAVGYSAQGARQVRLIQKIVNAGEAKFLAAPAQNLVAIAQDFNAVAAERGGNFVGADAKIVIAEDGKNAFAGLQFGKYLRNRLNVIP